MTQQLLPLEWRPFDNRGLFADNYLDNRLKALPEWEQPEGLDEAFEEIRKLYKQKAAHFTKKTNEAQTEPDFIQPVLDRLWQESSDGDCYQVQVRIANSDLQRQPDYAFFRKAADRQGAQLLLAKRKT